MTTSYPLHRVQPTDTDAINEMRLPITGTDGRVFDRALERRSRDPFVGPCPPWCTEASTGHPWVETNDEDRLHFGVEVAVLVRSFDVEDDRHGPEPLLVLQPAVLYLKQRESQTRPVVWLGRGESMTAFEFTLEEASEIAGVLTGLVKAAELTDGDVATPAT